MSKAVVVSIRDESDRYESERVIEEGRRAGIEIDKVFYEDLSANFDGVDKLGLLLNGKALNLSRYSWAYLRASSFSKGAFTGMKTVLISELMKSGVKVLNGSSFLANPILSKLRQYQVLCDSEIAHVKSYVTAAKIDAPFDYPYIAKGVTGSMGSKVFLVNDESELALLLKKFKIGKLIFQEYIETDSDYRVIVLGKKVVGAMQRFSPEDNFLTNISTGGWGKQCEVDEEMESLSLRAAKSMGLENVGVDLIRDSNGVFRVLEVNRHHQFKGFESVTGINMAGKIVKYLSGSK